MNVKSLTVRLPSGSELKVIGRDAWALDRLMSAGVVGCTPITQPAPRWSHYIYKLRVETITEPHGGTYAGTHARYVLRTPVTLIERAAA